MSNPVPQATVVSATGEGVYTSLAPVSGNILVDTGNTFPSTSAVQSLFASVAPGTIPGVGVSSFNTRTGAVTLTTTDVNSTLDVGNTVLVGGTVAVADTHVTASTVVNMSRKTIGGTTGNLSYTLSTGVGFTIHSS